MLTKPMATVDGDGHGFGHLLLAFNAAVCHTIHFIVDYYGCKKCDLTYDTFFKIKQSSSSILDHGL